VNSNKNSRKKLRNTQKKKKKTFTLKERLNNAKLEPKSKQIKYRSGKKTEIEKVISNLTKNNWVNTHFEKMNPGGLKPKKSKRTRSTKKKRNVSKRKKKQKKKRYLSSIPATTDINKDKFIISDDQSTLDMNGFK
jgi:hypothetical protein